jgi:hypothetical protein
MPITERDLLDEIGNIIHHNNVHGSAKFSGDSARVFFDPLELPEKLKSYIKDSRHESFTSVATMFGMSAKTLASIVNGGPLSENMLFRIRNSLDYARGHPGISVERDEGDTYFGDWRNTNTVEIQAAISDLALKLVFLKKVIESNNILNSSESPIDKIQIAQVIALLESTLVAITAPLVETGQTSGFVNFLKKLGKKGVEKGVEVAITHAIDGAVNSGSKLLHKLADASGTADVGTIIK